MKLSDGRALLAFDVTTRGLAFACFEAGEILDWGERLRRVRGDEHQIFERLAGEYAADLVVLEDPDAAGCKRHPRIRSVLRALAKHAKSKGIGVVLVSRGDVREEWTAQGTTNKSAVAAEIVSRFAELAPILPPRRRPGASEDPRANVFNAVSLVLHYSGH